MVCMIQGMYSPTLVYMPGLKNRIILILRNNDWLPNDKKWEAHGQVAYSCNISPCTGYRDIDNQCRDPIKKTYCRAWWQKLATNASFVRAIANLQIQFSKICNTCYISVLLAQETLFLTQKALFLSKVLQNSVLGLKIFFRIQAFRLTLSESPRNFFHHPCCRSGQLPNRQPHSLSFLVQRHMELSTICCQICW